MPPAAEPPVPFIDLAASHLPLRQQLLAAVVEVAASERYILGPEVEAFEAAFAERVGRRHAIGLSSGTDALLACLMALGVGPGDEVITTPFTFVSTAGVVRRLGARPVFADIDPGTLQLRVDRVRALLSSRTRVLLPVHLFGRLGDIEELVALGRDRDLPVLEDCAQALGAERGGRAAGAFGLAGAFSFFPTKNLGGWGDGGLLATDDDSLALRVRQLREHGAQARDDYRLLGGNFRLDALQAAVLRVKLTHLDTWLCERREAARRYNTWFSEAELAAGRDQTRHPAHRLLLPALGDGFEHACNLYVVRAEERDRLRAHLAARGVGSAVYYARPLHLQPCFADLGGRPGDLPAAEEAARSCLALPLFPGISPEQQRRVVEAVRTFYRPNVA